MVHPKNFVFVADFDNTCSVEDTSDLLISLGRKEACYEDIMTILCDNIENFLVDTSTSSKDPRDFLKQLEEFEKTTNQQVMEHSLLKGIPRKDIMTAAKTIPLHVGCAEFMEKLASLGTPVHIISANWSRDLIEGALPSLPQELLFIHSNDLNYDEYGVCNGTFSLEIQNSFDKESILRSCCSSEKMVVFIGDSMNDLLPMLDADLGIILATDMVMDEDLGGVIMDTNETLKKVLSLFNIEVLPLEAAFSVIQASEAPTSFRHTGKLFQVTTWAQVEACLLRARGSHEEEFY